MKVKNKLLTAFSSLKNHAAINKAVMSDRNILSDIDFAVSQCTNQYDRPIEENYVHDILFVVSNSPGSITFLARRITRQMEATKDLVVVLKTLVLVHRLLRSGDRYFEQDMQNLWFSRELVLDISWSAFDKGPLQFFLMSYSLFLEQRMSWVINQAGMLEPMRQSQSEIRSNDEDSAEVIFDRLTKCQIFLDRVMECFQGNLSWQSSAARSAMNMMLRESFRVYDSFSEAMDVTLSFYLKLDQSKMSLALDILEKASVQMSILHDFYEDCKRSMVGKSLDYPFVQMIKSTKVSEDTKTKGCQNEGQDYAMTHEDSAVPFYRKLETTISTIWVEFDEDGSQMSSIDVTNTADNSLVKTAI